MKRVFYLIAVPLVLFGVTLFLNSKPYYNWDMFPYMALASRSPSIPFETTHRDIYLEAAARMPASDFKAISERQPLLMANHQAFHGFLKYYEIKPIYLFAVRGFRSLGFDLVESTYLPSNISYFLIGCLLFFWMLRLFEVRVAVVVSLVLAASPFLIQTARYSSPDMLCALFTLAGLFLISETSITFGLLLCTLSIAVRPDAAILHFFILTTLYRSGKLTTSLTLLFSIMAVATVMLSIWDLSILKEILYTVPSYSPGRNTAEAVQNYGVSLRVGLSSIVNSQSAIFAFLALMTLYLRARVHPSLVRDYWSLLVLGTLASLIVRYLVHPVVEDRFQVAPYLIIMIGFCVTISHFQQNRSLTDR